MCWYLLKYLVDEINLFKFYLKFIKILIHIKIRIIHKILKIQILFKYFEFKMYVNLCNQLYYSYLICLVSSKVQKMVKDVEDKLLQLQELVV